MSFCTVFDSISSTIDEVISINPSVNVFVFGDFNVHHKDWLTYSGGTDRSGELCYNFSISNRLTPMVNFPTRIPDCDSLRPALLDLFFSSDDSICSTMAFPPLGNSDHVVVSVSIDFPSYSQQDATFHRIAYDYSCADWDGLCDHLRDVSWEDIFKLHFYVRAAEHMGISHLTNKCLKNVKQSAISDHVLTCDCNVNFNDFTILSKDSNNINLLIKESLLISHDKPILNTTVKSFALELFE